MITVGWTLALLARIAPLGAEDPPQDSLRIQVVNGCVDLLKLDETGAAITRLESLLQSDPEFVDGWLLLGNAFYLEKRYGAAIRAFERGLAREPNKAGLALPLGFCHFELGNVEDAERFFAALVQLQPENPKARYGLGFVLGKARQRGRDHAPGARRRARSEVLASTRRARRRPVRARRVCGGRSRVPARPSRRRLASVDVRYRLGLALQRQKKPADAKQALRRYRELNDLVTRVDGLRTRLLAAPGDDVARAQLAEAWCDLGQTSKAVGLARLVLSRDATNAVALGVVARARTTGDR
jgi:tetratricopeptide (TPR) repeat protein